MPVVQLSNGGEAVHAARVVQRPGHVLQRVPVGREKMYWWHTDKYHDNIKYHNNNKYHHHNNNLFYDNHIDYNFIPSTKT